MNGLTVRGQNGLSNTMKLSSVNIISVSALCKLVEDDFLRFESGVCYFGKIKTPFIGEKGWKEILSFLSNNIKVEKERHQSKEAALLLGCG